MKKTENSYKNLAKTITGMLRIKLFEKITSKPNIIPSKEESVSFIKKIAKSTYDVAELYTYILVDGACFNVNFSKLKLPDNLQRLLNDSDENPLSKPIFFSLDRANDIDQLCVWVNCHLLEDKSGYFYTFMYFNEAIFLDGFYSYVEVRTSKVNPEPAFVFNDFGETKKLSRESKEIDNSPFVTLSVKLLNCISENPIDNFTSLKKIAKIDFSRKEEDFPQDKHLISLLNDLSEGKICCITADIEMSTIIPFSYDQCFNIPLKFLDQAEKIATAISKRGILVYWNGNNFIMSDDYVSYVALRKSNFKKIKVVIVGEYPKNIQAISLGGFELLPPLLTLVDKQYDNFSQEIKESEFTKHLERLNSIKRIKTLSDSKCAVFTEDSFVEKIQCLLVANDFNLDETIFYSYKNCTRIDSIEFNLKTIKQINASIKVIIHRDRDYLMDEEIMEIEESISLLGAFPFITKGTDIESHYINENHINALYPFLSRDRIQQIIEEASNSTKETSIENILKHDHGDKYKKKTYLSSVVEKLYCENTPRYRHGKKTLNYITSIIQKEIKENPNLICPTDYLRDSLLLEYAKKIWY